MILRTMQAVFGRLDGEKLELRPGLNVLESPNESGKSTWCAFLLAMLYGVDTAQRATRTTLPDKTRYQPWSGKPMAGRLELTWQGRPVVLERTTAGRTPLGTLRAWDGESGRALDLPAAGCGQALLGVERSVYERSGFLRQGGLPLTGDHALEARLSALVSAGDDAVSCGAAMARLREQRNRCRHNRTGLLPQAQAELAEVRAQLEAQRQLSAETQGLRAQQADLEARRAALAADRDARQAPRRDQPQACWEKRRQALREREASVAGLPPMEELQSLLRQLDVWRETGAQLDEALAAAPAPPDPPPCPPALAGLDAADVRRQAAADAARLETLTRWGARWPAALLAVLAAASAAAGLLALRPLLAAAGLLLLLSALALAGGNRARRRRHALLADYGAADAADLRRTAGDLAEALEDRARQQAEAAALRDVLARRRQALDGQLPALLDAVRAFAPEVGDEPAARAAVQRAIHLRQFHEAAGREEARARLALLEAAAPGQTDAPAQLAGLEAQLADVRSRLDRCLGRQAASGDPAALAAREEALAAEAERLRQRYDALTLAMEALDQANAALQTRFAPQINRLAGQYMARMTGGRYDWVQLDRDMAVRAREAGATAAHPLQALSAGTADQLYLAVRLAVAETVLPPDAPLVLDDALVAFDDDRLAAALELLRELGRRRQILLFTCQRRERAWLDAHGKEDAPA